MELTTDIYRIAGDLPKHELYGLSSQLRRAAVSIPSNIAEGAARQSKKEFVQFLYCSLGSCSELETQIELSRLLGYFESDQTIPINEKRSRVAQMILGLIRSLKK